MNDLQRLSRDQLIDLVGQQSGSLAAQQAELQNRETELLNQAAELQNKEAELLNKEAELYRQLSLLKNKEAELQSQLDTVENKDAELRRRDITIQQQQQAIDKVQQQYETLQLEYNKLLQQRFGNRSERYLADPDQLRLDFGDSDEAADAALGLGDAVEDQQQTVIPEHTRRPRKKRDESLPEHLERYEVTAQIPDELKHCDDHGERKLLPETMWDRTETLEYEPGKLRVRVTIYPKLACENRPECGIVSPERPTGIVEGNKYDSSIAAEIITGKYSYHLPQYRLEDYFAGSGWNPSRSTQGNILTQAHFVIQPLLDYFKRQVQGDRVVGCDDTGVTLLYPKIIPEFDLSDPKQRRIQEVFAKALEENKPGIKAKMWAYRGMTIRLNVFDFTVSRHRDGPELFFADYEGTLLGDCWHGFESIAVASGGLIERAACNSHARRKFENSVSYPAERGLWLAWYQQLYDIEDRGAALSSEDRLELRQREAVPIWNEMETWLAGVPLRTTNVILPKSDMAGALHYVRNHLSELKRYLSDGLVPIDNNLTEQLMKQIAIGRKNWLFVGSVAGGERAAGFMTLASSALRNDLDVWKYVKDVLDRLLAGETDYEPLLPWNWAAENSDAIRNYRVKERQQRETRKRARRENRR